MYSCDNLSSLLGSISSPLAWPVSRGRHGKLVDNFSHESDVTSLQDPSAAVCPTTHIQTKHARQHAQTAHMARDGSWKATNCSLGVYLNVLENTPMEIVDSCLLICHTQQPLDRKHMCVCRDMTRMYHVETWLIYLETSLAYAGTWLVSFFLSFFSFFLSWVVKTRLNQWTKSKR